MKAMPNGGGRKYTFLVCVRSWVQLMDGPSEYAQQSKESLAGTASGVLSQIRHLVAA
jgi:hypothetical protein